MRNVDSCESTEAVIVARCSVTYEGRLGARLPEATRLLVLKADGPIVAGRAVLSPDPGLSLGLPELG